MCGVKVFGVIGGEVFSVHEKATLIFIIVAFLFHGEFMNSF